MTAPAEPLDRDAAVNARYMMAFAVYIPASTNPEPHTHLLLMRALLTLLLIAAALLSGCRPPQPAAEAPPAATLDLKQLMEWVIDPTADVIWDSVKWISTESGT